VILVDANILLHAYHPRSTSHAACRAWLEAALSGVVPLGLAWSTVHAFLRISTSARVFERPLGIGEAVDVVDRWLLQPAVTVVVPGERYWEILSHLVAAGQASGPLVMDAALAALALENGAVVCTTDRDFSRFPGVRTLSPLDEASAH
jgi:uncharacterized protein